MSISAIDFRQMVFSDIYSRCVSGNDKNIRIGIIAFFIIRAIVNKINKVIVFLKAYLR